jgi:hypothetical protein
MRKVMYLSVAMAKTHDLLMEIARKGIKLPKEDILMIYNRNIEEDDGSTMYAILVENCTVGKGTDTVMVGAVINVDPGSFRKVIPVNGLCAGIPPEPQIDMGM